MVAPLYPEDLKPILEALQRLADHGIDGTKGSAERHATLVNSTIPTVEKALQLHREHSARLRNSTPNIIGYDRAYDF